MSVNCTFLSNTHKFICFQADGNSDNNVEGKISVCEELALAKVDWTEIEASETC